MRATGKGKDTTVYPPPTQKHTLLTVSCYDPRDD